MADLAHAYTDKQIEKLQHEIEIVYKQAEIDIRHKMKDFEKRYRVKESAYKKAVKQGKMTQEQLDNWKKGQVFQRQQWNAKRASVINTMQNANATAVAMINGQTTNVFAVNANYASYLIEHDAGVNFGFDIYDSAAVVNLIKNNPQALPKWKINQAKDYVWSQKKVNRAVTQGIIQGESIYQIADRLSNKLVSANKDKMLTFARTAMTGAQNSGRLTSMKAAKNLGIDLEKEWMATLDSHTRDSHADIDGERVPIDSKFSNGLQYPGEAGGAPAEVYNCRCTMVSNVKKYPAEYKRYDNIDGKPIENMTYKEWYQAKGLSKGKQVAIDYTKYGNKETFEIFKKYKDVDDMIDNATKEEWKYINSFISSNDADASQLEKLMQEAKTEGVTKKTAKTTVKQTAEEKAAKKAEQAYEKAKEELAKIEDKIFNVGADEKFTGIWKDQTVTYADWEAKKASIAGKEQFYKEQIEQYKKEFYSEITPSKEAGEELYNLLSGYVYAPTWTEGSELAKLFKDLDLDKYDLPDVWAMYKGAHTKIEKVNDLLNKLDNFKQNGEEFSKLLAQRDTLKAEVAALKPKPDPSKIFGRDAYSQERKDAALWARSSEEADKAMRAGTGEVWRGATQAEKDAIYEYTRSFSKFNEPLRGWEYGETNYRTGTGFKGVGNTDLNAGSARNGSALNAMTDIIDKSTYSHDMWLQRGCDYGGMDKFFGVDADLLRHGTQQELENALLGTTPTEFGFMSCGTSKGKGFDGDVLLNIYAPEGTKMMYVEPFSAFGNGSGKTWDGIKEQSSYGHELETILQQGTQFRVVKVERTVDTVYVDLEVIDQSVQQRWIP